MSTLVKQSSSGTPLRFLMVDSTDHVTGKTGLTVTVTISKNGAAFAAPSGAVSEISGGWYKVAGNATDSNTLGPIDLHATATGADPTDVKDVAMVVAFDPADAAAFGLSRLDAAVSSRMATFTLPANFSSLSISAGGLVDILQTAADKVWGSTTRTLTALGSSLVSEIWNALLTGITTVGSVGKLLKDNIDAAISSRSTYAGADTAGTGTLLTRLTATRAGLLDNLDAAISSRSTYAGADTAGTGTLLTRLTAIRAGLIDNIDATISSRLAASGYTAPDNTGIAAIKTQTDKLVFTNVGRLDVQLRGCDVGIIDAAALASDAEAEIVAALKTAAFDGSYTFQQLVQIATAAVAAKLSGVGTGTIVVRDISDTKDLITMTVAAGGRTAVTFNV